MDPTETVLVLVVAALAVTALAERWHVPAPSLLVLAGLALGFVPGVATLDVPPELVTLGVLPPLLFAAALQISLPDLRAVWRPVAFLAVGLVLLSAAAVAVVTNWVDPELGIAVAFVLGAVLASTDPVAVTALSRRLRLPDRLATLVQAESLFNDATSLVLFQVAVGAVVVGGMSPPVAVGQFLLVAGGGLVVGLLVGFASAWLLERAQEPTLGTAVALVTPYAAAVAAEGLRVSPVMSVIVAGLVIAARRRLRPRARVMTASVYDVLVLVLESAVFALIGLELAAFVRDVPAAERPEVLPLLIAVTVTLLLVRGALLAVGLLARRSLGGAAPGGAGNGWGAAALVTWAGARGVIPLAAALSIPLTVADGSPFPHRELLLVVSAGAVVVSLVVQGLTLAPLVRRVRLAVDPADVALEEQAARHAVVRAALDELSRVADEAEAPEALVAQVRRELELRSAATRVEEADGRTAQAADLQDAARELRRRLVGVELDEAARLRSAGSISGDTYRGLVRELDLEAARLSGGAAGAAP